MRPLQKKINVFLVVYFFISIFECYAVDEDFYDADYDVPVSGVYDPIEDWNRQMWKLNNFLLDKFGKPINEGYVYITTQSVRTSVYNFSHNLSMPLTFVNYTLQFNIKNASKSLHSFIINSIFGLFGLFDVAKNNVEKTNFSITLAKYYVPPGPYLMIPILGPYNLRGLFGYVVEFVFNPLGYDGLNLANNKINEAYKYGITTINGINNLSFVMDGYYSLIDKSFDSYSFIRDAYMQYENNRINK
ncbi:MAG: VacJ family lipoprotein [Rickettsiales bacterium]|jgi:phospholipid-binding lipoprotein MlaA|nr:VacJ family lipoprotein [Rickettsiales bacterium]